MHCTLNGCARFNDEHKVPPSTCARELKPMNSCLASVFINGGRHFRASHRWEKFYLSFKRFLDRAAKSTSVVAFECHPALL
jgi:hypothetical protein